LIMRISSSETNDQIWTDDLPTADLIQGSTAPEAVASPESVEEDPATKNIKQMVLNSTRSESVLMGFLRNPKIVGIPGLVASVVERTRSVRVLETIAYDRSLHAGISNQDVPRGLLMSPANIPIKAISKFVHAKYVSKVDLKQMARNRTAIRKEVAQEIESYLNYLS